MNSPTNQIIGALNSDLKNDDNEKKEDFSVEGLSSSPQTTESVNKTKLDGSKVVKDEAQENTASVAIIDAKVKFEIAPDFDLTDAPADVELDSDQSNTKIEPTKAEEEAIARGLQTIKKDDLEEIR